MTGDIHDRLIAGIPFAAAQDGIFFRWLGALHPRGEFPHRSLLLVGFLCIVASFFSLGAVISALMTARILVEFLGRVIAALLLRRRPDVARPFRMWLYPLPAVLSLAGYAYVFAASGARFILYGLVTLTAGVLVYFATARRQRAWPFEKAAEIPTAVQNP